MSMSKKEREAYDIHVDNLMQQNDMYDTARTEGHAEGLAEGVNKVALNMIELGIDDDTIIKATGLSSTELLQLKR